MPLTGSRNHADCAGTGFHRFLHGDEEDNTLIDFIPDEGLNPLIYRKTSFSGRGQQHFANTNAARGNGYSDAPRL